MYLQGGIKTLVGSTVLEENKTKYIILYLDQGQLIVEPKGELSNELLEEIETHKTEIIDHLKIEYFARRVRSRSRRPNTLKFKR